MRYRRLFEAAQDGIMILDAGTGQIVDINPFLIDLLGYSYQELVAKKIWETGLFRDIEASKKAFRELQNKGYLRYEDLPLKTKAGKNIDVEFVSNVYEVDHHKVIQCNIRDITAQKRMAAVLQKQTRDLKERVKEMSFLVHISDLIRKPGISLEELMRRIADLIPVAYRCPEITSARIVVDDKECRTDNFRETAWKLDSPIMVHGKSAGRVEVCLLEERPDSDAAPFSKEKYLLLNNVTERLGRFIERNRMEAALEAEEKKYQYLVNNLNEGIWQIDAESRTTFINPRMAEILGYTVAEMLGKHLFSFMDEPGVELAKINLDRRQQGVREDHEFEFLRKDGTRCYAYLTTSPIKDETGKYAGALAGVVDITERKALETALRIKDSAIESAGNGICLMDLQGHVTYVNPALLQMWGYDNPAELIGKSVRDYLADTSRESAVLQEAQETGSWIGELFARRKDGTIFIIHGTVGLVKDQADKSLCLMASFLDVTVQKQAENEIKQSKDFIDLLLKLTPSAIFSVDRSRRITSWNRRAEELTGYSNAEVLGQECRLFFDASCREICRLFDDDTLKPIIDREGIIQKKDGQPIVVSMNCTTIRDEHGQVIGGIESFEDITERKQTEERLRQVVEEMVRSNLDLEQFAYSASHDIQEPLRVVASFLQLLEKKYQDTLDETGRDYIHRAVNGAKRAQVLIRDLLDYSRVAISEVGVFKPCAAEAILKTALENLMVPIEKTGAVVTHDPLPVVRGDAGQLVRVFQNLIANAVKFCEQKPPQVHISAADKDAEWRFAFRDNGIGIAAGDIQRLFTVFTRLHSQDKYPGSVVGLAICKRIMDRHGGRVWVESEPGQGSVFYLAFPKQEIDNAR